jgi:hypothetical protein
MPQLRGNETILGLNIFRAQNFGIIVKKNVKDGIGCVSEG